MRRAHKRRLVGDLPCGYKPALAGKVLNDEIDYFRRWMMEGFHPSSCTGLQVLKYAAAIPAAWQSGFRCFHHARGQRHVRIES
eukprot:2403758-Prymnesium_polylepis.1